MSSFQASIFRGSVSFGGRNWILSWHIMACFGFQSSTPLDQSDFYWSKQAPLRSCRSLCGCFLKWWYPRFHTPKWSFLVGKPMVVGETHHFRNPPCVNQAVCGQIRSQQSGRNRPDTEQTQELCPYYSTLSPQVPGEVPQVFHRFLFVFVGLGFTGPIFGWGIGTIVACFCWLRNLDATQMCQKHASAPYLTYFPKGCACRIAYQTYDVYKFMSTSWWSSTGPVYVVTVRMKINVPTWRITSIYSIISMYTSNCIFV